MNILFPYLVFSIILIPIGLWNLLIAVLGLFPGFHCTAVGSLEKTHTYKNVRTKSGIRIPNVTKYTYIYTVNGREYKYTSEGQHTKRRLPRKVTIVYVKWFPRHGYPDKFKGTKEWIMSICMLFYGIMLLLASFLP